MRSEVAPRDATGRGIAGFAGAPPTVLLLSGPSLLGEALAMFVAKALPDARLHRAEDPLAGDAAAPLAAAAVILVDEAIATPPLLADLRERSAAPIALLVSRGGATEPLLAGADAYILKSERPEAFAPIIDFVCAGHRYVSADLATDLRAETLWQGQLIERIPALIHVIQDNRRVYMNEAFRSRVRALVGERAGELGDRPFWELVAESQRAGMHEYVRAWFEDAPIASRIKVNMRSESASLWIQSSVCRVSFRGRPALGIVSADITDSVEGAVEFGCVLRACRFGAPAFERCRDCLYGLPLPVLPGAAAIEAAPAAAIAPAAERPAVAPPRTPAAFTRLTAQQLAVLRLIAEGRLNKQIAAELGIKEATVKGYIHRILRILNLPNRTAAALRYRAWIEDGTRDGA